MIVRIEFVKENLSFTGEDSPMANLMLSVMEAFAVFERALIRERQREEIAPAKLYVPFISSHTEMQLVNIKYIM
nr:recombinase family protein [Paenibacillus elgii]